MPESVWLVLKVAAVYALAIMVIRLMRLASLRWPEWRWLIGLLLAALAVTGVASIIWRVV